MLLSKKRIISSIVCIMFCMLEMRSFLYSQPYAYQITRTACFDIEPSEYGKIVGAYQGKTNQFVYIIQDVHCHAQAQMQIKNILSYIKKQYKENFRVVGVEGSSCSIDMNIFQNVSDKKLKTKVIKSLVQNGYMSGAEMYGASDVKIHIQGLEDKNIYEKDFDLLYSSLRYRNQMEHILKQFKIIINIGKERLYPKTLKEFEQKETLYKNGKITLDKFLSYVMKRAHVSSGMLKLYLDMKSIEKTIDIKAVQMEASMLTMLLKDQMTNQEYSLLHKYKGQNYYELLNNIVQRDGILIANRFPNLYRYFAYLEREKQINDLQLHQELEHIIYTIKENMVKGKGLIEEVWFCDTYLDMFEKYVQNDIDRESLEKYFTQKNLWYKSMTDVCDKFSYINIFEKNENMFKKIDFIMSKFYQYALKRDEILSQNMLKLMSGHKIGAMVIGGFHAEGVVKALRAKGISYKLIMPYIDGDMNQAKQIYIRRIQEQKNAYINYTNISDKEKKYNNVLSLSTLYPNCKLKEDKKVFIRNIEQQLCNSGVNQHDRKIFWQINCSHIKNLEHMLIDMNILKGKELVDQVQELDSDGGDTFFDVSDFNKDYDEFMDAFEKQDVLKIDIILARSKYKKELINNVNPKTGMRPLQVSIITDNHELIWYLISQGVNLDVRNNRGENIYSLLADTYNNIPLLDYLAKHKLAPKTDIYRPGAQNASLTMEEFNQWFQQINTQNFVQIFKMYNAKVIIDGFWKEYSSQFSCNPEAGDLGPFQHLLHTLFLCMGVVLLGLMVFFNITENKKMSSWEDVVFKILLPIITFALFVFGLWLSCSIFKKAIDKSSYLKKSMIPFVDAQGNNILDNAIKYKKHDLIWYLAVNYPELFTGFYSRTGKTLLHVLVADNEYIPIVRYIMFAMPAVFRGFDLNEQRKIRILLGHEANYVTRNLIPYQTTVSSISPIVIFNSTIFNNIFPIVFSNLLPVDLKICSLVCRKFYEFARKAEGWRKLAEQKFSKKEVNAVKKLFPSADYLDIYKILKKTSSFAVTCVDRSMTRQGVSTLVFDHQGRRAEITMRNMLSEIFVCMNDFVAVDVLRNAYVFSKEIINRIINRMYVENLIRSYKSGEKCQWWCDFIRRHLSSTESGLKEACNVQKILYKKNPKIINNKIYYSWTAENRRCLRISNVMLFYIGFMRKIGCEFTLSINDLLKIQESNEFICLKDLYDVDPDHIDRFGTIVVEKISSLDQMLPPAKKSSVYDMLVNVQLFLMHLVLNKEGLIKRENYYRKTHVYEDGQNTLFDFYKIELQALKSMDGDREELQLYQDGSVVWFLYNNNALVNTQLIRKPLCNEWVPVSAMLWVKREVEAMLKNSGIKISEYMMTKIVDFVLKCSRKNNIDDITISSIDFLMIRPSLTAS
jgi:hypothetical protein